MSWFDILYHAFAGLGFILVPVNLLYLAWTHLKRDEPINKTYSVLLVGLTGVGKSSTANSLCGKKYFKEEQNFTSITTKLHFSPSSDRMVHRGCAIDVMDMPGLKDTEKKGKKELLLIKKNMKAALTYADGFDAIILVMKYQRLTDDQINVIDEVDSLFGPDWMRKFGIIIITHGEDYKEKEKGPFEQWCHELVVKANENGSTNEKLGHIFKRFQSRVALFKNSDKSKSQQIAQRDKILDFLERLPKSRDERYTESNFESAKARRNALILSFDKDVLEKDVREKIENIERDVRENLKNTELSEKEKSEKFDKLVDQVTGEITKLKNKEKGSGALLKQIESLEKIREEIRAKKQEHEKERYEHQLEKTREEEGKKRKTVQDKLDYQLKRRNESNCILQ